LNILYLTYDGLNDPLGQSQILPYLEGLAEKGYGVIVISFEKGERSKLKAESQSSFADASEDKKLKVIQIKYNKSPPVLSTLYDIYLLKKEVKKVLKTQQINIIHCRSYITSLVGLWAKRKFGVKFIFDMRGFWADERVEGGLWNLKNPVFKSIYQYFKKKEKEFLLEANATISLTHNAKQEIEQNILADQSFMSTSRQLSESPNLQLHNSTTSQLHIEVIPTCADLDLFNSEKIPLAESNALRENLGIEKDDFVLLYLGSLGTWYMLEEMLDFFENLSSYVKTSADKKSESRNKKNVKFLFLTREEDEVIKAIAEREFDEDDFIITSCNRVEVPKYIFVCDTSIFFIIPTYSKKASAATKMGEIMAMGKPVITNTGWGDVDTIIPKSKSGILVDELSVKGYQIAIDALQNSNFNPEHIRSQAMEYFSLDKGIEQYAEIYQRIAKT